MDHNDPGEQSSWGSDKPFSGGNGCQTKGGGEQVTPCEVSLTLWVLSLEGRASAWFFALAQS